MALSFPAAREKVVRFPLPPVRRWRRGLLWADGGALGVFAAGTQLLLPGWELPLAWGGILATLYALLGLWRYPPMHEVSELRRMLGAYLSAWVLSGFLLSVPFHQALPLLPLAVVVGLINFVLRDFAKHLMGYNPVHQFLRVQGPFHRSDVQTWPYRWLKRPLDRILALFLLLLALPIIVLASLAVFLVDRRFPLFGHVREGLGGRPFRVWKIRTMYVDAERRLFAYLREHPELRDEWERYQKLRDDPRILPGVGRILRKTSVDELPQFWNVLKGEMSLVGPRPLPDYHLSRYSPVIRRLRQRALPGITGLWQVLVRSDGDVMMQQLLDAYYIQHWSMWLDLYILLKTIRVVVTGKGAY